jgi:hypothetical protein
VPRDDGRQLTACHYPERGTINTSPETGSAVEEVSS